MQIMLVYRDVLRDQQDVSRVRSLFDVSHEHSRVCNIALFLAAIGFSRRSMNFETASVGPEDPDTIGLIEGGSLWIFVRK